MIGWRRSCALTEGDRARQGVGAEIDVVAMAAIRATREAQIACRRDPGCDHRRPPGGRETDGQIFDGDAEAAVFPGIAGRSEAVFEGEAIACGRPKAIGASCAFPALRRPRRPAPRIRLDRALHSFFGDKLA